VLSPADALAIELLQLTGGVSYAFAQTPPNYVVTSAVADGAGFVCDTSALGEFYVQVCSSSSVRTRLRRSLPVRRAGESGWALPESRLATPPLGKSMV
jgi:hypothetical protein